MPFRCKENKYSENGDFIVLSSVDVHLVPGAGGGRQGRVMKTKGSIYGGSNIYQ